MYGNRRARSLRIRTALRTGWDQTAYARAITDIPDNQPPLF
ncbi:hypothetical protein [Corynebacterium sp. CCM 9203]